MASTDKINSLFNYILSRVSKHDFERGLDMHDNDCLGFSSYKEFIENQRYHLNECTESKIAFLEQLATMIEDSMIENMDMESMISFGTDGFCFNSDGYIVIFQ